MTSAYMSQTWRSSTGQGQAGVRLISLEIGVTKVLAAMMEPCNIEKTPMGTVQPNKFELLKGHYYNYNFYLRMNLLTSCKSCTPDALLEARAEMSVHTWRRFEERHCSRGEI